uniref:Uncharacterized protein n=1 Tax=Palpitomonas bilix TaxID=652834 RepID=A0A7S3G542_9EUKA|mmetsp:Transcript_26465/g.67707  ORF Transcript_26465/g.67707 Transcript_26465/m.67707 type:complete len:403 (+) Transcript_26465:72-1280(+)|eukprot:CAMPEP_0113896146 /NCGR_PEP_ID=MMETSP0780_2-20120614/17819_1 /TAXON_ID=652834 /ORGANISM="Palpitomonas bilix" /LENGTH=402 /DNA_ID=CAMNT_0000887181 /DNA_START=11 /DNA_END=1219 /DNA_ORIENTATION=- /assembly_acc=CAM_ASM_000599
MAARSTLAGAGVFIAGAKRTAFGTFGGTLKDFTPTQLGVFAAKGAIASSGVDPAAIDTAVFGNVQQTSADTIYLSRHIALKSGVKTETPCLTVNRLCGSGFQAVVTGAQEIVLGSSQIALTGGCESMSQAPFVARGMRFGTRLGVDVPLKDSLWEGLTDAHCKLPMAITAENLATQYGITKQDCDEYALRSQQAWAKAQADGVFVDEIAPVDVKGRKGVVSFEVDEHPRPTSTIEAIAKLPALFKKEDGTVSAGNASGVSDGAGALVIASESAMAEHNLTAMARVVGWSVAGVDPTVMGIGPVPAIRGLLEKASLTLDDIDLIEVNEAFAAQYLAVEKELGLNRDRANVNGGAIALGHPTGASGARILGHLAHVMKKNGLKRAIGSACIGGGQGIAVLLESA